MDIDIDLSEKMEKWASSVEFKESHNLLLSDVIVIVTHDNDLSFVENTLQDISVNKSITELAKNLEYGQSNRFNFILNNKLKEVIIISAGSRNLLSKADVEKLGGYIYSKIETDNAKVSIVNNIETIDFEDTAALITSGIILKSWTFDKYFTKKNNCKVSSITCVTNYVQINEYKYKILLSIDDCVLNTREMVTEPANVMNSEKIKDIAKELKEIGVEVRVIDQKEMTKMGMNALLGVNKGSDNPPYTIVMEYMNGEDDGNIVALVGKGVTFDAGGICIKPANRMSEMKGDMTGAAVVLNTVKSLALQKSKVNVIGAIGVVENVISSGAQRPGDVVQAMSGTTIEVDNTDAEGRLVLADVLWHVQERYGPKVVIDFATLTGAIQVALGHEFAGYMCNSDELAQHLEKASKNVGEKIWRLPLHKSYEPDIKSDIADIKNVGCGRGAGSITAAMFLQHFIKKTTKWAHIDIAATEWDSKDRALSQKGATGFGVRLMNDFIKNLFKR